MIQHTLEYLKKALNLDTTARVYRNSQLPAFLHWGYDIYSCVLGEKHCLLAVQKSGEHFTPSVISKNISYLTTLSGTTSIFVGETMPGYDRQRLLRNGTPFIIPDRQLYLPFLALVISEFGAKKQRIFDSIGTVGQLLFLRWLNGIVDGFNIVDAMAVTGYTKPSVIRAFDELEFFGIARRRGKTRRLVFLGNPKEQWENLREKLRNPCMRVVGMDAIPAELEVFPAGTEALSMRSKLSPGTQHEVAAFHTDFSRLKLPEIPVAEAPIRLELWKYRPFVMPDGAVDDFSLFLTLMNNKDERVQLCLEEMMKEKYDQRTNFVS